MADGLEKRPNLFPASPLSRNSSEPIPVSCHDVILDNQLHLHILIDNQRSSVRVTAQDETGKEVGVLEAEKPIYNSANSRLQRILCPDGQPGIGYVLLSELYQIAEEKGGTVFYSDIDETTRQWLIDNGLGRRYQKTTANSDI